MSEETNRAADAAAEPTRILITDMITVEMRGSYPNIELPADIDRTELGEDAFFVTLPVAAATESRNGRRYRREAMQRMVDEINRNRPHGNWGHMTESEMGTRFDPPAMRWLAATMDAEGVVWAKGMPITAEARDYLRNAKISNARVGTSLTAMAEMDGNEVAAMELISVDLADPSRVGIRQAAAIPRISREMHDTATDGAATETPEQDTVTETAHEVKNPMSEQQTPIEETAKVRELTAQINEMKRKARDYDAIMEALGTPEDGLLAVETMKARVTEMEVENRTLLQDSIRALVNEQVKVEHVRPMITRLIEKEQPATKAQLTLAAKRVLEMSEVKELLRIGMVTEMGPAQTTGGAERAPETTQDGWKKFVVLPGKEA